MTAFLWRGSLIRLLKNNIYHLGNQSSTAFLVSSGVFVGFLTQPNLLHIRWTWVSTPIPDNLSQATFMHIWAIFGPTPGKDTKPSMVDGISPPYSSWQTWVAFLMYVIFFCKKKQQIECQTDVYRCFFKSHGASFFLFLSHIFLFTSWASDLRYFSKGVLSLGLGF